MTKKTCGRIAFGCFFICVIILVAWVEGWPYAGQKCNWVSDCDLNETCVAIPYHQRDGSSYNGICMPKSY